MDNDRYWQVRPASLPDQVSGLIGDLRFVLRAFAYDRFPDAPRPPQGYVWLAVEDEQKLHAKIDEARCDADEVCAACNAVMQRLNEILPLAGKFAQPERKESYDRDGAPVGDYAGGAGGYAGSACEELTALRYQAERCLHAAYQR